MPTSVLLTGSQFDALPYEQGRQWELLDGEIIVVSSPTPARRVLLQRILLALMLHLQAHPEQGLALTDVEFALDDHCRVRSDILVLRGDRARSLDMHKVPVPGARHRGGNYFAFRTQLGYATESAILSAVRYAGDMASVPEVKVSGCAPGRGQHHLTG